MGTSIHPADELAAIEARAAALRAALIADREALVGATHNATVARVAGRDRVAVEPLPDLRHVLAVLSAPVVVVDTETTGLHQRDGDRMISLAVLPLGRDRPPAPRQAFAAYRLTVNPGRPSSPEAAAVHGMSDRELAMLPPFSAAMARQVDGHIGASAIVAHNAPFDAGFLDAEFAAVGVPFGLDTRHVVDTRILCKVLWPGEKGSLDVLATRLGVDCGERDAGHDALADARLLAACLPGLIAAVWDRVGERGA